MASIIVNGVTTSMPVKPNSDVVPGLCDQWNELSTIRRASRHLRNSCIRSLIEFLLGSLWDYNKDDNMFSQKSNGTCKMFLFV